MFNLLKSISGRFASFRSGWLLEPNSDGETNPLIVRSMFKQTLLTPQRSHLSMLNMAGSTKGGLAFYDEGTGGRCYATNGQTAVDATYNITNGQTLIFNIDGVSQTCTFSTSGATPITSGAATIDQITEAICAFFNTNNLDLSAVPIQFGEVDLPVVINGSFDPVTGFVGVTGGTAAAALGMVPNTSATSATTLAITAGANQYYDVSGSTQIDYISDTGFADFALIALKFGASAPVLRHAQGSPGGSAKAVYLQQKANYTPKNGETLYFIRLSNINADGVKYWVEVGRSSSFKGDYQIKPGLWVTLKAWFVHHSLANNRASNVMHNHVGDEVNDIFKNVNTLLERCFDAMKTAIVRTTGAHFIVNGGKLVAANTDKSAKVIFGFSRRKFGQDKGEFFYIEAAAENDSNGNLAANANDVKFMVRQANGTEVTVASIDISAGLMTIGNERPSVLVDLIPHSPTVLAYGTGASGAEAAAPDSAYTRRVNLGGFAQFRIVGRVSGTAGDANTFLRVYTNTTDTANTLSGASLLGSNGGETVVGAVTASLNSGNGVGWTDIPSNQRLDRVVQVAVRNTATAQRTPTFKYLGIEFR